MGLFLGDRGPEAPGEKEGEPIAREGDAALFSLIGLEVVEGFWEPEKGSFFSFPLSSAFPFSLLFTFSFSFSFSGEEERGGREEEEDAEEVEEETADE